MIGSWLALGIVTSVLVARSSWLAGVGLCSTVLVVVALTKWRVPQDLARTVVMLGVGFALGIGRIVVLHEPSPATAEAVGIVQWSADGLGSDLVALRDDGRLVALSAPSGATVGAGERVAWRGAYRPGRRRVAGIQVIGTYEVESIRVITGADALLAGVRARVRETVLSTIPEPSGSLALGVLIGDDRGLATETRAVLRRVGLSHLTAVSGWNVAVVAGFLEGLFRRIRWRTWVRLVPVGLGVWCYAVVTGLDPPVLRAATMASLYLLARWRGWPRQPISALGWAVVIVLLARPALIDSLAFQLSGIATAVLCVGGLVYRGRWESVVLPVFVQLAVTPLLLQRFGTYSLVAPLANVLVEPVVPVLMAVSVAVLVDLVVPGVGEVVGLPAWLAGRWIVAVGESLASMPNATGVTISPRGWIMAWLYLLCGTWILGWIDRRGTAP